MKTIKLPCYGVVVKLDGEGGGTITTEFRAGTEVADADEWTFRDNPLLDGAIDALEAIILAHACAGVDIKSPEYVEGIEVAVDKMFNEFT